MRRWLVLGAFAACTAEEPPADPPSAVSSAASPWTEVRPAAGSPLLEVPAYALADVDRRAEITVPSPARVLRVLVTPGDEVAAGAALLDLTFPELATAGALYTSTTEQLAALDRRHAQLDALRAEGLARVSELAAVELDQARLRGDRAGAKATLRAASVDPSLASELAETGGRFKLRAPIGGTVVKVDAAVGQLRTPDSGAVVELAGGGVHRVEAHLTRMLPPQASYVFVSSAGAERGAVLVRTEPQRAADGTTRAWFDVEGSGLLAGEAGRIRALVDASVVAVPTTALSNDGFLWRRHGDQRERVRVAVVSRSGADALVTGVVVGDLVIAKAEVTP